MYKYVLAGLLFGSSGMIMAAQLMDIDSDDEAMLTKDYTQQFFEGLVALYSEPQDTAILNARLNSLTKGTRSSNATHRLYAASHLETLRHRIYTLPATAALRKKTFRALLKLHPAFDEFYKARFPDPAADLDSE